MSVLTGPAIEEYRMRVLRKGLELEIKGMKMSRGRSCYAVLKDMGYKGTKKSVFDQLTKELDYESLRVQKPSEETVLNQGS